MVKDLQSLFLKVADGDKDLYRRNWACLKEDEPPVSTHLITFICYRNYRKGFCVINFAPFSFQKQKYMVFSDKAAGCVSRLLPDDKVMKLDKAVHFFQLDWKYHFAALGEHRVLQAYNMCFDKKNGKILDRALRYFVSNINTDSNGYP